MTDDTCPECFYSPAIFEDFARQRMSPRECFEREKLWLWFRSLDEDYVMK